MRKTIPVLLVSSILSLQGLAQERCGAMLNLEHRMKKDASIEKNMLFIERQTQQYINNNLKAGEDEVTIPVVVHVVYKLATENINANLVTSQIAVLNEDFRLMNADRNNAPAVFKSLQADIKVNFCLATVDPNGNPTSGITRTSTTTPQFTSTDDNVKFTSRGGRDAWPTNKYLNIWICALATPVGGVVGYAQFPGGAPETDGIVVDYQYFGRESYSYGRTTTHEVGHWLNLRHIWGDQPCGDDFVSDTPTQLDKNFGCPSHPHASCTLGGDMFMNYMDYTDGNCQNMFSVGQKNRMRALFGPGGFREGLKTSNGCGVNTSVCNIPAGLSSTGVTSSSATLNWSAASGANTYNVRYRTLGAGSWMTTTAATTSKAISGLTASSNYEFQIESVCSSGNSGFSGSATFTTGSTGGGTGGTATVGTGTTAFANAPYGTYYSDERSQFIITKAELMAAGYTGGSINLNSLSFNVTTASAQAMNGFTIRIGHTTATEFVTSGGLFGTTNFLSGANTTVFSASVTAAANQWNKHTFTTPFAYNGNDNLLIEICWDNSTYTTNSTVLSGVASANRTLYYQSDVASGGNCSNASGTKSTTRPNMKIEYSGSSPIANGIAEIGGKTAIRVYPNPAVHALNVIYELDVDSEVELTVFNTLGQLVTNLSMGKQDKGVHEQALDLNTGEFSSLKNGVYTLIVKSASGEQSSRLLIQRP